MITNNSDVPGQFVRDAFDHLDSIVAEIIDSLEPSAPDDVLIKDYKTELQ